MEFDLQKGPSPTKNTSQKSPIHGQNDKLVKMVPGDPFYGFGGSPPRFRDRFKISTLRETSQVHNVVGDFEDQLIQSEVENLSEIDGDDIPLSTFKRTRTDEVIFC